MSKKEEKVKNKTKKAKEATGPSLLIPVSSEIHLDDTVSANAASSLNPTQHDKNALAQLYEQQRSLYEQQRDLTTADREWFLKVTREGTAADKCSALALAIQEAPFYSIPHIKALGDIAANPKASHHETMMALERLTDVFSQILLPSHRRLYYLEYRPACGGDHQGRLLLWFFEDAIKAEFFKLLQTMEKSLKSTVAHNREVTSRLLYGLLLHNPFEQAGNSLALLVNKLGDPERKLASRISFYLEEIIKKHPKQTMAVIQAVLDLCSKPQIPEKALYYAVIFLSQVRFSRKHLDIPDKVFTAYCAFFKKYLVPGLLAFEKEKRAAAKKKGAELTAEEEQKLQDRVIPRIGKPLLTGINRALPFVEKVESLKELQAPLVKLASQGNLNAALPSLTLLHSVCQASNDLGTFFSTILNVTLADSNMNKLPHVASPLILMLQKVLQVERAANRNKYAGVVLKRLCQIALFVESRFGAALLIVVGSALKSQPGLLPMISMPSDSPTDDSDTLYELVLLAKHPNPLVAQLAHCILGEQFSSPLFARKPLDEVEHGSIIEAFVQWRRPHRLLSACNLVEFDFLDQLRPVMEANRPKRRAKDNVRKRTKKSKAQDKLEEQDDENDGSDASEAFSDEDEMLFDDDDLVDDDGDDFDDDDDDDNEVHFFEAKDEEGIDASVDDSE